jgi:hypothetical protein
MKKLTRCLCLASIACLEAQAADKRPAPVVIENCVSPDKLSFRSGESGSLLDAGDAKQVAAEIVRRYPMIERDGLYPTAIALWRRPGGDWAFATLMPKKRPANAVCFTANISGDRLDATPAMLKKYFGIAPAAS